ncbi:hypothetical protein AB6A40_004437 [Gnathostoma spinigerum]|uniref:Uncharacterized protein n=1 Tax=Gnathostoma spinigerum TaxID=75299 RepID=A0ABD6EL88_9BILA
MVWITACKEVAKKRCRAEKPDLEEKPKVFEKRNLFQILPGITLKKITNNIVGPEKIVNYEVKWTIESKSCDSCDRSRVATKPMRKSLIVSFSCYFPFLKLSAEKRAAKSE